jgi:prolyl oligopeptidase
VLVPLSLIYRKGLAMNGTAPVLLNGYGAYGISLTPYFNPYILTWTLEGGIYAVAHVRGGGEMGDAWRLAGHKTTKPNTWKDFIACAEFLAAERYTSPEKLAVFGGSAGGILIGRALTERPELFAAAIPMVGIMNPLRAEQSPNGPVNAPEFGTVKDSAECMALMEMDAYLHVEDDEDYPATLITAGFNDPRVIVWQPAKFAARLQAANSSGGPILFEVDYASGHGVGDTKSKSFEDIADLLTFALWQTGNKEFVLTD